MFTPHKNETDFDCKMLDCTNCEKVCPEAPQPDTGLTEECGVFAAYDFDGNDVASTIYYGLYEPQRSGPFE